MDIRWNTIKADQWTRALNRAKQPVPLQQHWGYGSAWEDWLGPVHRAEICNAGKVIALAQITCRSVLGVAHLGTCTHGPVWTGDISVEEQTEALRLIRKTVPLPLLRCVTLSPFETQAETLRRAGLHRVQTNYSTAVIDLTQSQAALRAGLHGKWRNRLKRVERLNLTIAPAGLDNIFRAERAQKRRLKYRTYPEPMIRCYADRPKAARGFVIQEGANPMGYMLFLHHGSGATYQIGTTTPEGRQADAHTLLLWRAMLALKKSGVKTLDLGGISTDRLTGIARFKLGAGATVRQTAGSWT